MLNVIHSIIYNKSHPSLILNLNDSFVKIICFLQQNSSFFSASVHTFAEKKTSTNFVGHIGN